MDNTLTAPAVPDQRELLSPDLEGIISKMLRALAPMLKMMTKSASTKDSNMLGMRFTGGLVISLEEQGVKTDWVVTEAQLNRILAPIVAKHVK